MKSALILFVSNPEPGKVKTAIASQMGDTAAVEIYKKLLRHTKSIAQSITADVYVFCSDPIIVNDLWNEPPFYKALQQGHSFIERLGNAFRSLYAKGYDKVAYICTDCLELSKETLRQTFQQLNNTNVVIGPSNEGGLYLLAATTFVPSFFEKEIKQKEWCSFLITTAESLQLSTHILPVLHEVETAEDCKKYPQLV